MAMIPVVERVVLHWGEMASRWGVSRTVAQIHALLYLSDRPLPADEIADTLNVARSNVSISMRELQAWGLIKPVHVLGDRREHFEALQDITQLFRIIVEERKKRELDPTIALLRECAGADDPRTPAFVRQRLKSTLTFLELLHKWYADMKDLPVPLFLSLLRMGGKLQRFLTKEIA
jgi:DNA-binding transcriptional regulator GbsR (MarR family)